MKYIILFALILLAGCDKVVSTTSHPEQAFVEKSTQSCNAGPGYCCEFGYKGGEMKHYCGMHMSCNGSQPITQRVIPQTVRYESGKVVESRTTQTLSVDGGCVN